MCLLINIFHLHHLYLFIRIKSQRINNKVVNKFERITQNKIIFISQFYLPFIVLNLTRTTLLCLYNISVVDMQVLVTFLILEMETIHKVQLYAFYAAKSYPRTKDRLIASDFFFRLS